MKSEIKATMTERKTAFVSINVLDEMEGLFLIDGIINQFSIATGKPVSKLLADLQDWNKRMERAKIYQ